MRSLIRRLEESDRWKKSALTRLSREDEKRDDKARFAANALLDSMKMVFKRAKAGGYYNLKFSDRSVQKQYDDGWKNLRGALSALKGADGEEGMTGAADDAVFLMSKAADLFFRVSAAAASDPVVASSLQLIKAILDEIASARETWRLSAGF